MSSSSSNAIVGAEPVNRGASANQAQFPATTSTGFTTTCNPTTSTTPSWADEVDALVESGDHTYIQDLKLSSFPYNVALEMKIDDPADEDCASCSSTNPLHPNVPSARRRRQRILRQLTRQHPNANPQSIDKMYRNIVSLQFDTPVPSPAEPTRTPDTELHPTVAKYGDHTIETTGNIPCPITDLPSNNTPKMGGLVEKMIAIDVVNIQIAWDPAPNFAIRIRSFKHLGTTVGTIGPAVHADTHVSPSFPPGTIIDLCPCQLVASHQLADVIDPARIAAKMGVGTAADVRALGSFIPNVLGPMNRPLSEAIGTTLRSVTRQYDNTYLYAKLMHYALNYVRLAQEGIVPNLNAFAAANAIQYIDIADNANVIPAASALNSGRFVFVRDHDMTIEDFQILSWLAHAGHRMQTPVGVRVVPGIRYQWQPIQISVIGQGHLDPAVVNPPIAHLSYSNILRFCLKMAALRNEEVFFVRGFYRALETSFASALTLVEAALGPPVVAGTIRPLDARFQTARHLYPRPCEFNPLARWILFSDRDMSTIDSGDIPHIMNNSPPTVARYAALIFASIREATSTVMQHYSMSGNALQMYCGNHVQGRFGDFLTMATDDVLSLQSPTGAHNLDLHELIESLLLDWFGLSLPPHIYNGMEWNNRGHGANYANALAGYAAAYGAAPPHEGNSLALDDFIARRPSDWAMCNVAPICHFSEELLMASPQVADLGFYSSMGCKEYQAKATTNLAYIHEPYGMLAINVIAQTLRLAAAPVLSAQPFIRGLGSTGWQLPAILFAPDIVWIPALHCFQPNTWTTYDWVGGNVLAPCLRDAALNAGQLSILYNRVKGPFLDAGISSRQIPFLPTPGIFIPLGKPKLGGRANPVPPPPEN